MMNPLTHEFGEKKPLFYTTYFFLKAIATSTALGALVGRVLKWYTPSHGAIMGAFSGAIGFAATRISGNENTRPQAIIARLHEEKATIYRKHGVSEQEMVAQEFKQLLGGTGLELNRITFSVEEQSKLAQIKKQSDEAGQNLMNINALCFFSYLAAPLAAKLFQKSTDLRLAFRFHLSSSFIGHFAFSKLRQTFFAGMSENGRGAWLENWAEKEWLTRAPSDLPPINAKVRWENFTRVPKIIPLNDNLPNSKVEQWKNLCAKINWGSRASPLLTVQKALECIDKEATKDTTYRYTQNLLAQLYVKLDQEKDPEKQKSNLIFLEEELIKCQSKWLDAIYKTLQNYESEKSTIILKFQENLQPSTLKQWEELCATITDWGTTQEVNEGILTERSVTSPFQELKDAFEGIYQQPSLPQQEGSYQNAANFVAQLYHKLAAEKNLEELKRFLLETRSNLLQHTSLEQAIHKTLSQYLKERSNQIHSEIEQWSLVIDQEIREDLLKNKITRDFEASLSDVHTYEVVKGALAKEGLFTNLGETDGHAQFEQANPGAKELIAFLNCGTDPFDALRKNVQASKSQWIASFKHRYHAEILFEVFKERLNLTFNQDKDKFRDIRLALAQNIRKLLGEDKLSLAQAANLVEKELTEGYWMDEEEEDLRMFVPARFNDSGVIFFLQTFGFFEASNEIVPGKTNEELLKAYVPKN
ncbi:MAG: hypothetical protein JSR80_04595 [Verrucomicrobia bacterium]|nr:hypothetical protein [Verrucomicrobiota bacterium]